MPQRGADPPCGVALVGASPVHARPTNRGCAGGSVGRGRLQEHSLATESPRARGTTPRPRVAVRFWTVLALCLCTTGELAAQALDTPWGTNGTVTAIARSGRTIYVGGTFTIVGPSTGSGMAVSGTSGEPVGPSPRIAGTIYAVAPDGAGGWYVGGSIVGITGRPCGNLAHVMSDGRVTAWSPSLDGPVLALSCSGRVLYVGGNFHSVDGRTRGMAAAFDVQSGRLTRWDPQADGLVRAILAYRGSVFIGGDFVRIGGVGRSHLAKVSGDSGQVEPWVSDADDAVAAFAAANDTLYLGGYFTSLQGRSRQLIGAVNTCTGALLGFDPAGVPEPPLGASRELSRVTALAVSGGALYVGGHFIGMGGQARIGLAEVDRATGSATTWAPALGPRYAGWPTPTVRTLMVCGSRLFVGGNFSTIDSLEQDYAAQFDLAGGTLTAWDPRPNDVVYTIAGAGEHVFVGGGFTSQWSWVRRDGLAAVDAVTGELQPWNPQSDAVVITALAAGGGKVFASGMFSSLGGQPRSNLAAVDSATGLALAWDPHANNAALTMVLAAGALYGGGYFTNIGGSTRSYAAKLDTVTGAAMPWDPGCDDWVQAIAVKDDEVYLGGWFRRAGGQARSRLVAVDTLTGTATSWAPDPDGPLMALAVGDSIVAVGGAFAHIGGASHSGVACVSRITGRAEDWNLDIDGGGVHTVGVAGPLVYAAGDFSYIGGEQRQGVAAIDGTSGQILPWRYDLDGVAWTSLANDDGLRLGGAFTVAGYVPAAGLAVLDPPAIQPPAGGQVVVLDQTSPNPARDVAQISYVLRTAASATLVAFDPAGRRIATVFRNEWHQAGPQRESIRTADWRPGCYFLRLEVGGASVVRKMLVVR